MKYNSTLPILPFFLGVMIGPLFAADNAPAVRMVGCDEKVQSHKRGVCENKMGEADFRALAPGVSWFYDWHYETADLPPSGVSMEFIPMAWGDRQDSLDGLEKYLQGAAKKPRVVLAINEPNLKDQAFISPEKTAGLYQKIKDIADKYQLSVVGPNMSLGSPTEGSITAMDPIENKQMTYTFMTPFLKAFFFYLGKTDAPALGLHTYGSIGELKWAVDSMHREFHRPIWVTEYAEWNASDDKAERDYLVQATDFLERTPYVAGYAWFKERADNAKISLLAEPGKLTALGEAYVNLPVHDSDLYYRIPGKLAAGKYVAMDQTDILSNSHNDLLVSSNASGASVDYNIGVDAAGTYKISLRAFGAGKIDLVEKNQVLASAPVGGDEVQTLELSVPLPEGPQTLRISFGGPGMILSSLEFAKP